MKATVKAIVILLVIGAAALTCFSQMNDSRRTTAIMRVNATSLAQIIALPNSTPSPSTQRDHFRTLPSVLEATSTTVTAYTSEAATTLIELVLQNSHSFPAGNRAILNAVADALQGADAVATKKTVQNAMAVLMMFANSLDTDTGKLLQHALKALNEFQQAAL